MLERGSVCSAWVLELGFARKNFAGEYFAREHKKRAEFLATRHTVGRQARQVARLVMLAC